MRVAMYYNNRDVRLEEMPEPKIGPGEILVKILATGICGSDVMEWYRLSKAPLVLGHEIAGEIVRTGEGVGKLKPGDRVTVAHHVPCNTCRYCLSGRHSMCDTLRSTTFDPGGFAEFLRVPAINVDRGTFLLPEGISYEEGSFAEPLACVYRGQRLAGFRPGSTVFVIGSGISGMIHIHLASTLGAGRVIATDINKYRLEMAGRFGADAVFEAGDDMADRLREANHGRLADIVILCTAAPQAVSQAFRTVDRGGTILLFACSQWGMDVPVPLWDLWRDGITVTSSYAGPPEDTSTALELIASGRMRLKDMITHRLPLAEAADGFRLVEDGGECLKVIIEPHR
ncbi:zinc-dependent dehydrogenase [Acidobacteriota bacterium]